MPVGEVTGIIYKIINGGTLRATCICGETVVGQNFQELEIMMSVHAEQSGHTFKQK